MKTRVFCVYDSKLRGFLSPFMASNVEIAKRSFATAVNDPNLQVGQHPEDYTLFEIATWDDELGHYEPLVKHINHGLASAYKVRQE